MFTISFCLIRIRRQCIHLVEPCGLDHYSAGSLQSLLTPNNCPRTQYDSLTFILVMSCCQNSISPGIAELEKISRYGSEPERRRQQHNINIMKSTYNNTQFYYHESLIAIVIIIIIIIVASNYAFITTINT